MNASLAQGSTNSFTRSIVLTNSTAGTITYTLSVPNQPSWLNVSYSTAPLTLQSGGTASVGVSAIASGLAAGTYSTTLVVQGNFSTSPINIPITLTVTSDSQSQAQAPTVSYINPTSAAVGTTVNVFGANFDNATFIGLDGAYGTAIQPSSITLISPNQLSFVLPSLSAGSHTVAVAEKAGPWNLSNPVTLTITGATASASLDVTSMSFSTGGKDTAGPLVTGSASNVSQVSVDIKGSGAKTYVVNGRWQAYLNSVYPGTYDVQISDNDSGPNYGIVLARGTLTVSSPSTPKPVITWTSAKAAGNLEVDAGGEVDINGSNLATVDSTQVYIGGLSAPVTWVSDSQVNATVPSTLTIGQYYDLYIVNRNGTSNTVRVHVVGTTASPQTNPVVISSFTASQTFVTPGQPMTFSWSSNITSNDIQQYGGGCWINGLSTSNQQLYVNGGAAGSGSVNYNPGVTATYTLLCTSGGKDGSPSASKQLTVTVSYAAGLPQCPANSAQQRGQVGQTIACSCQPGFALGTVQGGGIPGGYYTDNSDICTAGVQVGQLNNTYGGEVDYKITPALTSYPGWTGNGITSPQGTDNWPGSFQIVGPKACLAAGTAISMSDGSHKNIENIQVGDAVKSFNGGKASTAVVTSLIEREDPIVTINGALKAAPDEIVYLANGTTKTANRLTIGDQLLGEGGRSIAVTAIAHSGIVKTYDMALENGNAFFADGYLVQSLTPLSK